MYRKRRAVTWERNSNHKVVEYNKDIIFPEVGVELSKEMIRSISFSPETMVKLNALQDKYKLSRSAIVRILVDKEISIEQPKVIAP